MYISKIQLTNWKNFRDAQAELSKRVFIIGPNASGKSNFLDALRFLRDVANSGLAEAVDARGGVSSLRCLAARGKKNDVGVDVTISDHDGKELWRYLLSFTQSPAKVPRVKKELVHNIQKGETIQDRPSKEDKKDEVLLTQTSLEQIIANREFRDLADLFKNIEYQHIVPQIVRDPQGFGAGPVHGDPYGRDFLAIVWDTSTNTRTAWLKRIAQVLRSAVPQLEDIEIEQDTRGTPHLIGRFKQWRPKPARYDESQFSDGTLRLFGLLWSFFSGKGPLLLEEPELSLHPEVVSLLPQLFYNLQREIQHMRREKPTGQRQLIISTHSREMLEDKGIAAEEILYIVPDQEGSRLLGPDIEDRKLISAGLSAADVMIPKTRPKKLHEAQLSLMFSAQQKINTPS